MFETGNVVEINTGHNKYLCLITQVSPHKVCPVHLLTGNRFYEPVSVIDRDNIQIRDIVDPRFINEHTVIKVADDFYEYLERETKKNTKNSEVVGSSVKTYSINDTIVVSELGEEYKIVPLVANGVNHIILINKKSFTRWTEPVQVGDWKRITQVEMEEAVGDSDFYKKEN